MDLNRVEAIYDEIFGMSIELEPDPTVLGPRYINSVVATCRNYQNRVTAILLEIQREKRGVAKNLAGEKAAYQVELSQLLAENAAIKAAPNIKDREAQANTLLASRVSKVTELEAQLLDLDTIEKAVRLRHQELVRTSDNIKTQRSLLMADRVSGAGYGDEFEGRRDAKGRALPPEDDGIDEAEIDRIMAKEAAGLGADAEGSGEVVETKPVVQTQSELVVDLEPVETKPLVAEPAPEPKPEPVVEAKPEPVVEAKTEPTPEPPPVVEAKPEPVAPVETKPVSNTVPDPMDAILAEVAIETPKAQEPAPEPAVKAEVKETPVPETASLVAESEVAAFLDKEEPIKTNGTSSKNGKKADKKEEKPKEAQSAPAGGDDFDFDSILKNL